MRKFNTSDIFTGYLKQLLKTFNLPKLKVYTKEHKDYYEKNLKERADILNTITEAVNEKGEKYLPNDIHYVPYIKDGKIQEYINNKWQLIGGREDVATNSKYYVYGEKLLNYTKNLVIQNNVYDSYTHEYLGDYLRFQRDYNNLNLMPLYNCFSNRSCTKLNIKDTFIKWFDQEEAGIYEAEVTLDFNTSDQNYKIYMLPVKLFQTYTVAVDSNSPVEFCCGIYGEYQDTRDKFKSLPRMSYLKINKCQFSKPFLFDTLSIESTYSWSPDLKKEIAKNEADLKLFIKLPKDNDSTIVILEGNYLNWNDSLFIKQRDQIIDITGDFIQSTRLEEAPEEATIDKIYLVETPSEKDDVSTYSLYKAHSKTKSWIHLGTVLGRLTSDEIVGPVKNKFEFINDNETVATDKITTVQEAFQSYRKNHSSSSISKPYVAYYNHDFKKLLLPSTGWKKQINHSVINIEATPKGVTGDNDIPLITNLQLLQFNTHEQHPFANRLIEYLVENVITNSNSEIGYNVRRVQKALEGNNLQNKYYKEFAGIWDYKMNKLIYEYMNTHNTALDVNHDILGYVDKDVEKYYTYKDYYTLKPISLINVELDEEDR